MAPIPVERSAGQTVIWAYADSDSHVASAVASATYRSAFTVTFNPQGGHVDPETKNVVWGQQYGSLPEPTRSDLDFSGWFTNVAGDGEQVTHESQVTIADDLELFANWKPDEELDDSEIETLVTSTFEETLLSSGWTPAGDGAFIAAFDDPDLTHDEDGNMVFDVSSFFAFTDRIVGPSFEVTSTGGEGGWLGVRNDDTQSLYVQFEVPFSGWFRVGEWSSDPFPRSAVLGNVPGITGYRIEIGDVLF